MNKRTTIAGLIGIAGIALVAAGRALGVEIADEHTRLIVEIVGYIVTATGFGGSAIAAGPGDVAAKAFERESSLDIVRTGHQRS